MIITPVDTQSKVKGNIMLNVFIETSGKAHPNDKGPFVVVAVIIKHENLEKIKFGIQELKLLYFGSYNINTRLTVNDIVHGVENLSKLTVEKRSEILDRMMKILEISDVKIAYSVIKNKESGKQNANEMTLLIEQLALNELALRVYLASRHFSDSEIRLVIDGPQWDHDIHLSEGVRKLIFDFFKQKGKLALIDNYNVAPPILSSSIEEPFIGLVNFIAYVVRNNYYRIRRKYNYSFTKYYTVIQSKLYKGFDDSDPKAGIFEI